MEFENKFSVEAPIDEVYATLLDIERVAPCVPGAQVLEQTGDDSYKVGIKVKLGPVTQQYRGDVEVVERDDAAHQAVMSAKAREARGQGTANARVTMSLTEEGGKTHGTIASDVRLSGKAASMGQRMVKDVSTRLIDQFSTNLEAMLAGDGASEPAAAGDGADAAGGGPAAGGAAQSTPPERSTGDASPAPEAPPRPAPPAEPEGLPIMSIVGGVIGSRLKEPPVIAGLAAVVVVLLLLVRGRR